MPENYSYLARTRTGQKRTGVIQAESPERVAAVLYEQELIPTQIRLQKRNFRLVLFGFMKGRQYEDLIFFTRNLSTLYHAGIPLLRALSIIKVGPSGSHFNQIVDKIRSSVQSGRSLSDAMSEFPGIFSKIYTSSIAAGEASGKLNEILDSLAIMLERDLELNRQIKSSLRYPTMVVVAIAAAFAVVITFVIPRFISFYSSMGAQLPAPTRALIWLNQFITHYWIVVLAGLIALVFILKKIYASTAGKLFFDTRFLQVPVFGDLIIKGNIARFSYMFHLLMKSGIPIVKALELLAATVKNSRLTIEVKMLADSFREGRELSGLLGKLVFFPELALQMIKVGLESGSLESMLNEVAVHYSKEVDYKSRHLTALLEPILTVVLGVFVLIVALAIFLPMWNLIHVIKG
jgi:type II secretory pathway component PulF